MYKTFTLFGQDEKAKVMRIINEYSYDDSMDTESLETKVKNVFGQSTLGLAFRDKFIYDCLVVDKSSDYLMWPCFDELDIDFFIKAARYPILLIGLLKGNMGFHDGDIMNCSIFTSHDFGHAYFIMKAANAASLSEQETAPEIIQNILAEIEAAMTEKALSAQVKDAVRIWLFYYQHEVYCEKRPMSLALIKSKGFVADLHEKELFDSIIMGYYTFDDEMKHKDFDCAHQFLNELFPLNNSSSDFKGDSNKRPKY